MLSVHRKLLHIFFLPRFFLSSTLNFYVEHLDAVFCLVGHSGLENVVLALQKKTTEKTI